MKLIINRDISEIRSFSGTVVIIDVLRAVTSMCCLFHSGVKHIFIKSNQQECFIYQQQHPDSLILGEKNGQQIEGFDLGNSPEKLLKKNVNGRSIAMLTSNCTRGVLAAENASSIYCAGLVNIGAVADSLIEHSPEQVLIAPMGKLDGKCPADEACAEYLHNCLSGIDPDFETLRTSIMNSSEARKFSDPNLPHFSVQDLEICLSLNRFPFVLTARTTDRFTEIVNKNPYPTTSFNS